MKSKSGAIKCHANVAIVVPYLLESARCERTSSGKGFLIAFRDRETAEPSLLPCSLKRGCRGLGRNSVTLRIIRFGRFPKVLGRR